MQFPALEKRMQTYRRGRNALAAVLAVMLAANLLLAWLLVQKTSQTILIPSRVSDGMIAQGAGDIRYLEALSLDAVQAMYTLSPATTIYSRQVIERLASPADRDKLLQIFDDTSRDIRTREISTVFLPEKIEHDMPNMTLRVTGMFATYIDTTKVTEERRAIQVVFAEFGGSVRVARIERIAPPQDSQPKEGGN